MESGTSEVSEVPDFIYVAGGQTYIATSQEEVSKIISSYERATIARFVVEHQSTKFGTEDWHDKKLFRWSLKSVPSAFGPAIVIGTKVLCCHQGKDRHLNFKKLKREQTRLKRMAKDQSIKEEDTTARKTTKKVNCPATIYIKKVAFFPDYQVTEATAHRKRMACKRFNQDRLKRPESIKVDVKFFVTLPDSKEHRNHLSGDDLFKKIMKNRTLYDPQASIPKKKKKKKKKSKKHRKREKRKEKGVEMEEESLENIAFSFLPNASATESQSLPQYGGNGSEQLIAGQGNSAMEQNTNAGGHCMDVARESLDVAGTIMGDIGHSVGVVDDRFNSAGQRVHIEGQGINIRSQRLNVLGQSENPMGHALDVAGQRNDITGHCMNLPAERSDMVVKEGIETCIPGQRFDVPGQEIGVIRHNEDALGQDLITVDRRQLLPLDHL